MPQDNMTKAIYVVTRGDYSSYRIKGVYISRYKARKVLKLHGEDARIETYKLNDMGKYPQNMYPWRVRMNKYGDVQSVQNESCEYFKEENSFESYDEILRVNVWAKDQKHAIKIANEQRTQLIAENKWPEGIQTPFN